MSEVAGQLNVPQEAHLFCNKNYIGHLFYWSVFLLVAFLIGQFFYWSVPILFVSISFIVEYFYYWSAILLVSVGDIFKQYSFKGQYFLLVNIFQLPRSSPRRTTGWRRQPS